MSGAFEQFIGACVDADHMDRGWLRNTIDEALDVSQFVLVTGEPGAGKTFLLAGLARDRPGWLRYFVRRDSRTALTGGDLQSFLLSVGHQLAASCPEIFEPDLLEVVVTQRLGSVEPGGGVVGIRIEDLKVSPFRRTASLRVDQEAGDVAGSLTGVEIGRASIEPRLLEPHNLAALALLDPAAALARTDPGARIVIVIDALDELVDMADSGLFDWLAREAAPPENIRFVLASRQHTGIALLRTGRAGALTEITIDPRSPNVADDLTRYASRAVSRPPISEILAAESVEPEAFQAAAVTRAAGNFLYLSAFLRAFEDCTDNALLQRMLAMSALPQPLTALYAFFLDAISTDLSRLGPLGDHSVPAWEGVGQPLLGLMAVAERALTEDELIALADLRVGKRDVRNVLGRLRWLLGAVRQDRLGYFHSSLPEYLLSPETAAEHPTWAVDGSEWDDRIVRHYRGTAASWDLIDWNSIDDYGVRHLATHVARCRPAADSVDLVCPGLRSALRATTGNDRQFAHIADLAAHRAIDDLPSADALPAALFLGVARRQALLSVRGIVPEGLSLLARLGEFDQAIAHLRAIDRPDQRLASLVEILPYAPAGQRRDLVESMVEAALAHPPNPFTRPEALRTAALRLAPYDLPRALALWADRGFESADAPVYFAAAAASPIEAPALIRAASAGRCAAWLDLYETTGDTVHLQAAEDDLDTEDPISRLRCLGRLAAAVTDPAHSARLIADLDSAFDSTEPAYELVSAIQPLVTAHPNAALGLLNRLEPRLIGTATRWGLLGAAETLLDLNEPGRARRLLDAYAEAANDETDPLCQTGVTHGMNRSF